MSRISENRSYGKGKGYRTSSDTMEFDRPKWELGTLSLGLLVRSFLSFLMLPSQSFFPSCLCSCLPRIPFILVCVYESSELRIFYPVPRSLVPDPVSDFGLLGTTKVSCLIRADISLSSPPPCDYLWVSLCLVAIDWYRGSFHCRISS